MTKTVDLIPLDNFLTTLPEKTTAVIPILQRAQAMYGYLPRKILQRVTDRLNIPQGRVYSVEILL